MTDIDSLIQLAEENIKLADSQILYWIECNGFHTADIWEETKKVYSFWLSKLKELKQSLPQTESGLRWVKVSEGLPNFKIPTFVYVKGYERDNCVIIQENDGYICFYVESFNELKLLSKIIKGHSRLNDIEWLDESGNQDGWISVDDRPLFIFRADSSWECTEDGNGEFIAAVPYEDKRKPGVNLWWIRHCVVEDAIGLCVVGDDDNIPAGWEMGAITHWQPLPAPPKGTEP